MPRPLTIHLARGGLALALLALVFSPVSLRAQASRPAFPAPPAPPTPPALSPAQQTGAQDDAQAAAAAWLTLTDGGSYADSWDAAASLFHQQITKDGWVTLLKSGLPVFGKVVTRKLKTTTFTRILPGAPDGEYVVILYDTQFANTGAAVETLATVLEPGGTWKVCGYHIK
jgi:hypothetical protein